MRRASLNMLVRDMADKVAYGASIPHCCGRLSISLRCEG